MTFQQIERYTCDHCGALVAPHTRVGLTLYANRFDYAGAIECEFRLNEKLDLCPACHKHLAAWLKGKALP